MFTSSLEPKRLELLHELLSGANLIGVLANPSFTAGDLSAKTRLEELPANANRIGQHIIFLNASSENSIDVAFAKGAQERIEGLLVASDPFLHGRRAQIVSLAARYALPAVYPYREFTLAGGLISYGTSLDEAYRQTGAYTGKILKGARPAELPVQQSMKMELVINLKAAKVLGITIPTPLLARADEVIE
jgi:putative ABC transport system substrate-binding protein